jgi:hypothetical protein
MNAILLNYSNTRIILFRKQKLSTIPVYVMLHEMVNTIMLNYCCHLPKT